MALDSARIIRTLALAAATTLAMGWVFTHDAQAERRWELGGFGGFQTFADGNRLSVPDDLSTSALELPKDRAPFWGARLSYSPIPHIGLEIEAGQSPTSFTKSEVDLTTLLYRLQAVGYLKGPGPGFKPFVLLGIGGMRGSPSNSFLDIEQDGESIQLATSNETDLEYHLGVGLKYQVGDSLGARADLRYRRTSTESDNGKGELEALVGMYVRI